jgi:hypothetical protein
MRLFVVVVSFVVLAWHGEAPAGDASGTQVPALSGDLVQQGYQLSFARRTDGEYALQIDDTNAHGCYVSGTVVANYLFVERSSGKQRWLFSEHQPCIWRSIYLPRKGERPDAVVYDLTPGGALSTWGFRFCTGTNPCLPLRRLFASRVDGRQLTALTDTFQILDDHDGLASVTQQADGAIVVSLPFSHRIEARFDIATFEPILSAGSAK